MKPATDLRSFVAQLEAAGDLLRVEQPINLHLELTALAQRVLQDAGPALWIAQPQRAGQVLAMPVLANLFGHPRRICRALGLNDLHALRDFGQALAALREPQPPRGWSGLRQVRDLAGTLWAMRPRVVHDPACQSVVWAGADVDLGRLPVQHCWPEDVAPLITWGLTITRGPHKARQNLGIYRLQVLGANQVIVRWLAHRGGAQDFREHAQAHPGQPFALCVALGADPATLLGAVTPVPDTLSEYQFAGLLRGARTEVASALGSDLQVPAGAEIVLEGVIAPDPQHPSGYAHAPEGPFGDHTGYYNEVAEHPVMTVQRITHRVAPIYPSTHTGRPPDEPAMLALALGELFVPLLQQQFPEVVDFYLPPEGCSYRLAVVSIRKAYPGHAQRMLMGLWGALRQFSYTKFIIVVDDDIDVRNWADVIWALTTRVDPARDVTLVERTPIDYLDFASPVAGLGSKMGLDATHKWPGETSREWGRPLRMDTAVQARMDALWAGLQAARGPTTGPR